MVVASDVFPLVHALLIGAGFRKSAVALAKEAKLQPKAIHVEHDLVDVYKFYLTHHTKGRMKTAKVPVLSVMDVTKKTHKKKRESSSESDSSVSSGDEKMLTQKGKKVTKGDKMSKGDQKSKGDKAQGAKKVAKKTVAGKTKVLSSSVSEKDATVKKEASSSEDSSESDESSDEEKKSLVRKAALAEKKKVSDEKSDLSSSDDSLDSSDSSDEETVQSKKRKTETPAAQKIIKKVKYEPQSSSEESSSSESDSSESDTDSSEDEEALEKENARRKEAAKAALEWQPKKIEKVATKDKAAGTPFQRVDGDYWSQKIVDDTLRDNSYEGTFGVDGVGVKANNKLLKTRGKDFTKGKNKLKRSTYMCGAISMASNSFKFEE